LGGKYEEDYAIPAMCPAKGCLRWPKAIATPLAASARRGLVSRVEWGGMSIGTLASPPPCLLGPFGSDVRGGPCCG
jgi:hypothetical protein